MPGSGQEAPPVARADCLRESTGDRDEALGSPNLTLSEIALYRFPSVSSILGQPAWTTLAIHEIISTREKLECCPACCEPIPIRRVLPSWRAGRSFALCMWPRGSGHTCAGADRSLSYHTNSNLSQRADTPACAGADRSLGYHTDSNLSQRADSYACAGPDRRLGYRTDSNLSQHADSYAVARLGNRDRGSIENEPQYRVGRRVHTLQQRELAVPRRRSNCPRQERRRRRCWQFHCSTEQRRHRNGGRLESRSICKAGDLNESSQRVRRSRRCRLIYRREQRVQQHRRDVNNGPYPRPSGANLHSIPLTDGLRTPILLQALGLASVTCYTNSSYFLGWLLAG